MTPSPPKTVGHLGPHQEPEVRAHHCPACAKEVDPLRAGAVAILGGQFTYFCDNDCKGRHLASSAAFDGATAEPPAIVTRGFQRSVSAPVTPSPSPVVATTPAAHSTSAMTPASTSAEVPAPLPDPAANVRVATAPEAPTASEVMSGDTPAPQEEASASDPRPESSPPPTRGTSSVVEVRARPDAQERDAPERDIDANAVVPAGSIMATRLALALPAFAWVCGVAALVLLFMLPSIVLAAGVPLGTGVAALVLSALVVPGRRALALLSQLPVVLSTCVVGASVVLAQASQSATALLAVNVVSTATQALLLRWAFESHRRTHRDRRKYVYDAIVAAHVRRALRILVQVALFLTTLGALASSLLLGRALDVALAVAAVVSSFAVVPLWLAFGWATERVEDEVAASGATLVSSDALDVAMRLEVLVVAGRSATLTVEPTVATTSIVGRREDETRFTEADLGALVIAAQEVAPRSPLRTALRQAFAGRAEKLRQATFHPGLGVIAERTNGQRLLVGSRALMLTHHISTARADAAERTPGSRLVYVALANRLVGYVTLEEPPRQTARPALLRLLDAGIEPVLVSAETREVCEALAETLDLAHIRPEVAHEDRPRELTTFTQAGAVVGVVGDPVDDADLLSLGHLAIELPHEDTVLPPRFACSVRMGSRDLTGAAVLLCESHALARSERRALIAVLLPAALAALAVSFGVAPPLIAPLGALAAAAIVLSPVVFPASNRASYGR